MDLSSYFSSRAKYKILELLANEGIEFRLRQVSGFLDLPVRSVELGLRHLERDKLVKKKITRGYTYFLLNEKHPASGWIRKLFQFIRLKKLEERSGEYVRTAHAYLNFLNSINRMNFNAD